MIFQTLVFSTKGSADLVVLLFSLLLSVKLTSSTRQTLVRLTSALQALEEMMEDEAWCGRCGACRHGTSLEELRRDVQILVERRVTRREILRTVVWQLYTAVCRLLSLFPLHQQPRKYYHRFLSLPRLFGKHIYLYKVTRRLYDITEPS